MKTSIPDMFKASMNTGKASKVSGEERSNPLKTNITVEGNTVIITHSMSIHDFVDSLIHAQILTRSNHDIIEIQNAIVRLYVVTFGPQVTETTREDIINEIHERFKL